METKQFTIKIPVKFEVKSAELLLKFLAEFEVMKLVEAIEQTERYSVLYQSNETMGVDDNLLWRMRQLKYAIGQLDKNAPKFYKEQL